jgi:TldD protein
VERRDFVRLTGTAVGALAVPIPGWRGGGVLGALTPIPTADKKALADVALNTGRARGATYVDVRIARYLNQFITARDTKVQNITNTESYGCGIRVIANGTWGFAATNDVTPDGLARAATQAVAIARANSRLQSEPVRLAAEPSHGEVAWRTPIKKNAFDVPISEKADLLLAASSAALQNGADFVNSLLFLVNEQKYFASTDGSYIDQDVHRIWPTFVVTSVNTQTGKFETRNALSAPRGLGRVPRRPGDGQGGRPCRRGERHIPRLLRHGRGREARGAAGEGEAHGENGRGREVRPRTGSDEPLAHDPRIGWASAGARPGAGLRSQLCRHQLRHAR